MMRAMTLLSDELDKELNAEIGLSFSDVVVLVQLAIAGGRLKMADIADTIVVTRGGVTKLMDRLVRLGYVRRVPSDADRRVIFAELAEEGREVIRKGQPVLESVVESRVADLLTPRHLDLMHDIAHTLTCDNEGWGMPEAIGDDTEPAAAGI